MLLYCSVPRLETFATELCEARHSNQIQTHRVVFNGMELFRPLTWEAAPHEGRIGFGCSGTLNSVAWALAAS